MNAGQAAAFDAALAGQPARLVGDDGRILPVAVERWLAPADSEDDWLLDRCIGPTVDLGRGPGRLVAELAQRGVPALGVDRSPRAVAGLRAITALAVPIELRVANRHCGDRCFIEPRYLAEENHVSGR